MPAYPAAHATPDGADHPTERSISPPVSPVVTYPAVVGVVHTIAEQDMSKAIWRWWWWRRRRRWWWWWWSRCPGWRVQMGTIWHSKIGVDGGT